jgi:hypothetical protein
MLVSVCAVNAKGWSVNDVGHHVRQDQGWDQLTPRRMNTTSLTADDTTPIDAVERKTPERHGVDLQASRHMAARLRLLIRANPEPSPARWQTMGQALWRTDPLADQLVAWMHAQGVGDAWRQLEQALQSPDGNRAGQPLALAEFMATTSRRPEWVDVDKLADGARVLQSTGLHGMMVLRDAGLMAGYQASAINQTLVMTGALHTGAQRRVATTTAWWLACTDDGGMAPGHAGFNMTLRVRVMHAMVRHQLLASGKWDEGYLGKPINQLDMQATYLAFSVVQLLALKTTGVWVTRSESAAVMHLWRYIGWLMGVEESLLCDAEQQGRISLYQNVLSQAPADETSVMLARALMDEPLQRHYPNAAKLRGVINKARHLSLVRWFVGASGMRALGLPPTWPWYPLLMMGPLAVWSLMLRVVPGLKPLGTRWARRRQREYLKVLTSG